MDNYPSSIKYMGDVEKWEKAKGVFDRGLLAVLKYRIRVDSTINPATTKAFVPMTGQLIYFRSLIVGIIRAVSVGGTEWDCDVTGGPYREEPFADYNKLSEQEKQELCAYCEANPYVGYMPGKGGLGRVVTFKDASEEEMNNIAVIVAAAGAAAGVT